MQPSLLELVVLISCHRPSYPPYLHTGAERHIPPMGGASHAETKRKKTANLSRKTTPWDADHERTPLQEFIRQNHIDLYEKHHAPLKETAESEIINAYIPEIYLNCKSKIFKRYGKNSNFVQVYKCFGCGSKFTPTTGTIFDRRKNICFRMD